MELSILSARDFNVEKTGDSSSSPRRCIFRLVANHCRGVHPPYVIAQPGTDPAGAHPEDKTVQASNAGPAERKK